jgi:hypothetical protein
VINEMIVKEEKFIVFSIEDLVGISDAQIRILDEIDQLVQVNRIKRGASQFPNFIFLSPLKHIDEGGSK